MAHQTDIDRTLCRTPDVVMVLDSRCAYTVRRERTSIRIQDGTSGGGDRPSVEQSARLFRDEGIVFDDHFVTFPVYEERVFPLGAGGIDLPGIGTALEVFKSGGSNEFGRRE